MAKLKFVISLSLVCIILLITTFYLLNSESSVKAKRNILSNESISKGKIENIYYTQTYEGKTYNKSVDIYLPPNYNPNKRMNILYLLHGSTGDSEETTLAMKDILDEMINTKKIEPLIAAFPTYYPDKSFVVANYSVDYPLNHFFATDEIDKVLESVESKYLTYADNITKEGLKASREHRAFGGYSMGAVTTWDILKEKSEYFYTYIPMAGDSWIDRITGDNTDEQISNTILSGLRKNNYTANDFNIIVMVGENDGTKYSILPQLEALRKYNSDIINAENLEYYENSNGGHNLDSFQKEVAYALPKLFK